MRRERGRARRRRFAWGGGGALPPRKPRAAAGMAPAHAFSATRDVSRHSWQPSVVWKHPSTPAMGRARGGREGGGLFFPFSSRRRGGAAAAAAAGWAGCQCGLDHRFDADARHRLPIEPHHRPRHLKGTMPGPVAGWKAAPVLRPGRFSWRPDSEPAPPRLPSPSYLSRLRSISTSGRHSRCL
jgi:hypothetical protein